MTEEPFMHTYEEGLKDGGMVALITLASMLRQAGHAEAAAFVQDVQESCYPRVFPSV